MDNMKRKLLATFSVVYSAIAAQSAHAVAPASLAQVPLFLVNSAEPQVMLNMSNDHQLFYKAYDDWSDVDGDGVIDITYDHGITYYGYFDSFVCYDYDGVADRFEPAEETSDKYCDSVSGEWSGNFLNWASMTRIDTVRKILFGGVRSTDTGSLTVLERAFLPNDAHSFAKYYAEETAGEIAKLTPWDVAEITICNTTYGTAGYSEDSTQPPLMRIAEGNFALWAANERWQCHWDGEAEGTSDGGTNNGNNPDDTGLAADPNNPDWDDDRLGDGDYIVRVEVCSSDPDKTATEKCKVYPDGNRKPIGLLQEYGDDGQIAFGLMTGSFQHNKTGGTLRKNVGPITDEINVDTNGTFKTAPAAGNIIGNLSALRISGYCYNCFGAQGTYNSTGGDNCIWGLNSFNNGQCTNWGNPQSEIYFESLRYFAGKTALGIYQADDSSYLSDFITATSWVDPLSEANYCAPLNIIQFNASVSSYDFNDDEYPQLGDLEDLTSINTWTDDIGVAVDDVDGAGEGIDDNEFFIGGGTYTTNGLCTAKTLQHLSAAKGLCPEAPRAQGSYKIAGLAYYAHTTSIRDDIDDTDGVPAEIKVKTYGVTLAPAVPKIEVPNPANPSQALVTILPACRNQSVGGNCAIVDFKVVQKHTESVDYEGVYTGKFYVNWEDSEQGGDYDQDMAGTLSYEYNSNNNTITVITKTFADSTPYKMAFGYILSGTLNDGFHAHSGIEDFDEEVDTTGVATCGSGGVNCSVDEPATSVTYTLGTTDAELLKDPLYYAAKWGGFEEDEFTVSEGGTRPDAAAEPNDRPDQTYEWDDNGDGLPDAYFYSTNPAELETSLAAVFLDVTSGTAAASSTAANSFRVSTGTTIFQARFNPLAWTGELLAFPVNPLNGQLSDTPSWDAGAKLQLQAWDSRVIITNNAGTGVPFAWSSLNTTQKTFLMMDPDTLTTDADSVVAAAIGEDRLEYLRGNTDHELQNGGQFRDRLRKLGDLVNSSPAYVGAPGFNYPNWLEKYENTSDPTVVTNSSAETYSEYTTRMAALNTGAGRTPMLYVGGNDGMLHGFTAYPEAALGGIEKLAFVPNAVYARYEDSPQTPSLGQLTSPDYEHRYFVDGSPTVGDVLMTDNDWHTILVGGLNAGGRGIYALDVTNPSAYTEASASNIFLWEVETTSGGDFDHLGYTYSRPAIVKNHSGTNAYTYEAGEGKWVAMFGNGYASASGYAVFYVVNAETGALVDSVILDDTGDNGLSTVSPVDLDGDYKIDVVYAGDLKGNLWKLIPDGTLTGWRADFVGSTCADPSTADDFCTPLFAAPVVDGVDPRPITMRPEVGRHPDGLPGTMVYFGTGSYFKSGDNVGDADTHSVYGIWDPWDSCFDPADGSRRIRCASSYSKIVDESPVTPPTTPSISRSNLLMQCVTGTDGSTCMSKVTSPGPSNTTTGLINDFEIRLVSQNVLDVWDWDASRGVMGWYLDLPDYGEKQVTRHTLRGGRLIFVTIIPSDHACEDGGESWLVEMDARSGGRLDETVFDLDGDGFFSYDDNWEGSTSGPGGAVPGIPATMKRSKEGITQPPSIVDDGKGEKEYKYASGSKGGVEVTTESRASSALGRKSWVRLK